MRDNRGQIARVAAILVLALATFLSALCACEKPKTRPPAKTTFDDADIVLRIAFVSEGETLREIRVARNPDGKFVPGADAAFEPSPRDGFRFLGWYDELRKWDPSESMRGNLELVAKWEFSDPIRIDVEGTKCAFSYDAKSRSCAYDVPFDASEADFSRLIELRGVNYSFKIFKSLEDCADPAKALDPPALKLEGAETECFARLYDSSGAPAADELEPIRICVRRQAVRVATFYDENGVRIAKIDCPSGEPIPAPAEYSRLGHAVRWLDSKARDGSAIVWRFGPNGTPVESDVSLYADCVRNKYRITLDPDGGSVAKTSVEVEYAGKADLPVPTAEGRDFIGWSLKDSGGDMPITDGDGRMLDPWSVPRDAKLTAKYDARSESVTVTTKLSRDGAEGESAEKTFLANFGEEIDLRAAESRYGAARRDAETGAWEICAFDGWFDASGRFLSRARSLRVKTEKPTALEERWFAIGIESNMRGLRQDVEFLDASGKAARSLDRGDEFFVRVCPDAEGHKRTFFGFAEDPPSCEAMRRFRADGPKTIHTDWRELTAAIVSFEIDGAEAGDHPEIRLNGAPYLAPEPVAIRRGKPVGFEIEPSGEYAFMGLYECADARRANRLTDGYAMRPEYAVMEDSLELKAVWRSVAKCVKITNEWEGGEARENEGLKPKIDAETDFAGGTYAIEADVPDGWYLASLRDSRGNGVELASLGAERVIPGEGVELIATFRRIATKVASNVPDAGSASERRYESVGLLDERPEDWNADPGKSGSDRYLTRIDEYELAEKFEPGRRNYYVATGFVRRGAFERVPDDWAESDRTGRSAKYFEAKRIEPATKFSPERKVFAARCGKIAPGETRLGGPRFALRWLPARKFVAGLEYRATRFAERGPFTLEPEGFPGEYRVRSGEGTARDPYEYAPAGEFAPGAKYYLPLGSECVGRLEECPEDWNAAGDPSAPSAKYLVEQRAKLEGETLGEEALAIIGYDSLDSRGAEPEDFGAFELPKYFDCDFVPAERFERGVEYYVAAYANVGRPTERPEDWNSGPGGESMRSDRYRVRNYVLAPKFEKGAEYYLPSHALANSGRGSFDACPSDWNGAGDPNARSDKYRLEEHSLARTFVKDFGYFAAKGYGDGRTYAEKPDDWNAWDDGDDLSTKYYVRNYSLATAFDASEEYYAAGFEPRVFGEKPGDWNPADPDNISSSVYYVEKYRPSAAFVASMRYYAKTDLTLSEFPSDWNAASDPSAPSDRYCEPEWGAYAFARRYVEGGEYSIFEYSQSLGENDERHLLARELAQEFVAGARYFVKSGYVGPERHSARPEDWAANPAADASDKYFALKRELATHFDPGVEYERITDYAGPTAYVDRPSDWGLTERAAKSARYFIRDYALAPRFDSGARYFVVDGYAKRAETDDCPADWTDEGPKANARSDRYRMIRYDVADGFEAGVRYYPIKYAECEPMRVLPRDWGGADASEPSDRYYEKIGAEHRLAARFAPGARYYLEDGIETRGILTDFPNGHYVAREGEGGAIEYSPVPASVECPKIGETYYVAAEYVSALPGDGKYSDPLPKFPDGYFELGAEGAHVPASGAPADGRIYYVVSGYVPALPSQGAAYANPLPGFPDGYFVKGEGDEYASATGEMPVEGVAYYKKTGEGEYEPAIPEGDGKYKDPLPGFPIGYWARTGEGTAGDPFVYSPAAGAPAEGKTYCVAVAYANDAETPLPGFPDGYFARSGAGTADDPFAYSLATGESPEVGAAYCLASGYVPALEGDGRYSDPLPGFPTGYFARAGESPYRYAPAIGAPIDGETYCVVSAYAPAPGGAPYGRPEDWARRSLRHFVLKKRTHRLARKFERGVEYFLEREFPAHCVEFGFAGATAGESAWLKASTRDGHEWLGWYRIDPLDPSAREFVGAEDGIMLEDLTADGGMYEACRRPIAYELGVAQFLYEKDESGEFEYDEKTGLYEPRGSNPGAQRWTLSRRADGACADIRVEIAPSDRPGGEISLIADIRGGYRFDGWFDASGGFLSFDPTHSFGFDEFGSRFEARFTSLPEEYEVSVCNPFGNESRKLTGWLFADGAEKAADAATGAKSDRIDLFAAMRKTGEVDECGNEIAHEICTVRTHTAAGGLVGNDAEGYIYAGLYSVTGTGLDRDGKKVSGGAFDPLDFSDVYEFDVTELRNGEGKKTLDLEARWVRAGEDKEKMSVSFDDAPNAGPGELRCMARGTTEKCNAVLVARPNHGRRFLGWKRGDETFMAQAYEGPLTGFDSARFDSSGGKIAPKPTPGPEGGEYGISCVRLSANDPDEPSAYVDMAYFSCASSEGRQFLGWFRNDETRPYATTRNFERRLEDIADGDSFAPRWRRTDAKPVFCAAPEGRIAASVAGFDADGAPILEHRLTIGTGEGYSKTGFASRPDDWRAGQSATDETPSDKYFVRDASGAYRLAESFAPERQYYARRSLRRAVFSACPADWNADGDPTKPSDRYFVEYPLAPRYEAGTDYYAKAYAAAGPFSDLPADWNASHDGEGVSDAYFVWDEDAAEYAPASHFEPSETYFRQSGYAPARASVVREAPDDWNADGDPTKPSDRYFARYALAPRFAPGEAYFAPTEYENIGKLGERPADWSTSGGTDATRSDRYFTNFALAPRFEKGREYRVVGYGKRKKLDDCPEDWNAGGDPAAPSDRYCVDSVFARKFDPAFAPKFDSAAEYFKIEYAEIFLSDAPDDWNADGNPDAPSDKYFVEASGSGYALAESFVSGTKHYARACFDDAPKKYASAPGDWNADRNSEMPSDRYCAKTDRYAFAPVFMPGVAYSVPDGYVARGPFETRPEDWSADPCATDDSPSDRYFEFAESLRAFAARFVPGGPDYYVYSMFEKPRPFYVGLGDFNGLIFRGWSVDAPDVDEPVSDAFECAAPQDGLRGAYKARWRDVDLDVEIAKDAGAKSVSHSFYEKTSGNATSLHVVLSAEISSGYRFTRWEWISGFGPRVEESDKTCERRIWDVDLGLESNLPADRKLKFKAVTPSYVNLSKIEGKTDDGEEVAIYVSADGSEGGEYAVAPKLPGRAFDGWYKKERPNAPVAYGLRYDFGSDKPDEARYSALTGARVSVPREYADAVCLYGVRMNALSVEIFLEAEIPSGHAFFLRDSVGRVVRTEGGECRLTEGAYSVEFKRISEIEFERESGAVERTIGVSSEFKRATCECVGFGRAAFAEDGSEHYESRLALNARFDDSSYEFMGWRRRDSAGDMELIGVEPRVIVPALESDAEFDALFGKYRLEFDNPAPEAGRVVVDGYEIVVEFDLNTDDASIIRDESVAARFVDGRAAVSLGLGDRLRPPDETLDRDFGGRAFAGWYEDRATLRPFDFDAELKRGAVLYAKWIEADADEAVLVPGVRADVSSDSVRAYRFACLVDGGHALSSTNAARAAAEISCVDLSSPDRDAQKFALPGKSTATFVLSLRRGAEYRIEISGSDAVFLQIERPELDVRAFRSNLVPYGETVAFRAVPARPDGEVEVANAPVVVRASEFGGFMRGERNASEPLRGAKDDCGFIAYPLEYRLHYSDYAAFADASGVIAFVPLWRRGSLELILAQSNGGTLSVAYSPGTITSADDPSGATPVPPTWTAEAVKPNSGYEFARWELFDASTGAYSPVPGASSTWSLDVLDSDSTGAPIPRDIALRAVWRRLSGSEIRVSYSLGDPAARGSRYNPPSFNATQSPIPLQPAEIYVPASDLPSTAYCEKDGGEYRFAQKWVARKEYFRLPSARFFASPPSDWDASDDSPSKKYCVFSSDSGRFAPAKGRAPAAGVAHYAFSPAAESFDACPADWARSALGERVLFEGWFLDPDFNQPISALDPSEFFEKDGEGDDARFVPLVAEIALHAKWGKRIPVIRLSADESGRRSFVLGQTRDFVPIVWDAISDDSGRIYALSRAILDVDRFRFTSNAPSGGYANAWADSSIRAALDAFLRDSLSFSDSERAAIDEVEIANGKATGDSTYGAKAWSAQPPTRDRLFLPAFTEISGISLVPEYSEYVRARHPDFSSGFWLRSCAGAASACVIVKPSGEFGDLSVDKPCGIRPAFILSSRYCA